MDVDKPFHCKLNYGETFEEQTLTILKTKLPDYQVFRTNQTPNHPDRITYKTVDIVVKSYNENDQNKEVLKEAVDVPVKEAVEVPGNELHTSFALECKLNTEYFRKCQEFNGWCPEDNVVINLESFRRYCQADFPIYIISHQKFPTCDYYRFWPMSKIVRGRRPGKMNFRGVTKLNFDASKWYSATTLEEAIEQIIKLEL